MPDPTDRGPPLAHPALPLDSIAEMPVYRLGSTPRFPPPEEAEEGGLLAVGGDLSAQRLLTAYAMGIFPWYQEEPILWYSPDPRTVLVPGELRLASTARSSQRRASEASPNSR